MIFASYADSGHLPWMLLLMIGIPGLAMWAAWAGPHAGEIARMQEREREAKKSR